MKNHSKNMMFVFFVKCKTLNKKRIQTTLQKFTMKLVSNKQTWIIIKKIFHKKQQKHN